MPQRHFGVAVVPHERQRRGSPETVETGTLGGGAYGWARTGGAGGGSDGAGGGGETAV